MTRACQQSGGKFGLGTNRPKDLVNWILTASAPQDAQNGPSFSPAHPAPQDAPFRGQCRSEVRDAKNNERHVCGRARAGERPVS
jgi:hypothetical protein